ncbi:adenylate/guanylate cyclase domain-containing protein [Mycobacterium sp. 1164985.4]|uniref:adenylate/guanylate cyclase domain-containing protein n=1 Tax=Mycobacterium sp. 1164985.4 TaxID=1834069 RepID=UPI0007FCE009|nr:adenylate/guanylate cyclase domain-containing protein [Mycobacterium sp. 1164985.4]OBK82637.1 hydrolase [Mycobacterium sp. 1164985.4]
MTDGRVHYARNGDVRLAYRVFGESGPLFVWAPGWVVSNVDTIDAPSSPYADIVERLSQGTRFVMFDRRGSGLSDPLTHAPSLDEKMDDFRAVIDTVSDGEVVLLGTGEGGSVCILFAATYPDRVSSLMLYGTAARFSQELPDFPWGFTAAEIQSQLDAIDDDWGDGALAELFFNEAADEPGVREMFGKLQRSIASPAMARLWWQTLMETDVRAVLPAVKARTLVAARPGSRLVPFEAAEALAAAIPGALFERLSPGAHNAFDLVDELSCMALEFVSGRPRESIDERVLKTVMFTDIVNSTERLSARGDAHWRHQLNSHDTLVDHLLALHGGVRAKHTGDGVFALFDAPTKAARCALDLVPSLTSRDIPIRVGIHTGECERRGQEWSGMAVHTGARIEALAVAGEVLASRTVRDLSAGSGLKFESLGPQRLKGLPEDVEVFRVTSG